MALDQTEILTTLKNIAQLGDEARTLLDTIRASREDGEVTPEERKSHRKAAKPLARKLVPIAAQFAIDVMD